MTLDYVLAKCLSLLIHIYLTLQNKLFTDSINTKNILATFATNLLQLNRFIMIGAR